MRFSWTMDHLSVSWLFLCHCSLEAQALKSRVVPPGDTPFKFCNDSKTTDLFTFEMTQLDPKPVLMYVQHAICISVCELRANIAWDRDEVFHVNAYGNLNDQNV
jgi:hypothetical protein